MKYLEKYGGWIGMTWSSTAYEPSLNDDKEELNDIMNIIRDVDSVFLMGGKVEGYSGWGDKWQFRVSIINFRRNGDKLTQNDSNTEIIRISKEVIDRVHNLGYSFWVEMYNAPSAMYNKRKLVTDLDESFWEPNPTSFAPSSIIHHVHFNITSD